MMKLTEKTHTQKKQYTHVIQASHWGRESRITANKQQYTMKNFLKKFARFRSKTITIKFLCSIF